MDRWVKVDVTETKRKDNLKKAVKQMEIKRHKCSADCDGEVDG